MYTQIIHPKRRESTSTDGLVKARGYREYEFLDFGCDLS